MSQGLPKHRALPEKEAKLFKTLLAHYEVKQFKKGIKAADTILKKFPNHGETLAIKALTLHSSLPIPATAASLPKQEEAEEMARLAIRKDMTSHLCWHVLGILAKSKKDWAEASKAFAMARKLDADNIPLIRDSISLYLHTRQYPQALAARHHYLTLRPQIRSSWLGLVVSHHLAGDIDEALRVYDAYLGAMKTDGATPTELSQVLLYIVKMSIEGGKNEEALGRLQKGMADGVISGRGEATQLKAQILITLGRREEAEDTYRALLEQNPDNLEFYRGFLRTKDLDIGKVPTYRQASVALNDRLVGPLDQESREKVLKHLSAFGESYPKSAAPRRLALDVAEGPIFRELASKYVTIGLERGVPSLFVDVKGVYGDAEKMKIVGDIVEEIVAKLEKDAGLYDDNTISPPTTLLWAYYYLALHLSHPRHPNPSHERSLELLSLALKHTPTLPEIRMAKAMVLKRAGDPEGAAHEMEEARALDGQDRFLNGKSGKYLLRAGDISKAEDIMALFTKKDMTSAADLTDMQCLWFLHEEGDAYRRSGNLGMALKRYQATATVSCPFALVAGDELTTVQVFQDYEDDQYDFHTYCLRRMTLSAYVALMRYEDQLRSHPAYFKASLSAIEIYLRLADDPSITEEKLTAEEEAERKKAAKKAQKAESKAKKAALTAAEGKKDEAPLPDEDPHGQKLLKTETPLEDALRLWKPLERLASARIETWIAGYDIAIRNKLYLQALRCLSNALGIDAQDSELHSRILNFKRIVASSTDLPSTTTATIDAIFTPILPNDTDLESYNSAFLSKHASSPKHILGAAKGFVEIKPTSSPLFILENLTKEDVPPSIETMVSGLALLKSEEDKKAFREKCSERLPLAWVFKGDTEKETRRTEWGGEKEELVTGKGQSDV
ncbi:N-alpha-acetyltransferase 15/16, NatA auxiliary subunit, partial [Tremellales sp. Uapishka_1]